MTATSDPSSSSASTPPTYTISLVGNQPSVGLSVNSTGTLSAAGKGTSRVFVTPLNRSSQGHGPKRVLQPTSNLPSQLLCQPSPMKKVLVKAVSKKGPKSDSKTFSIRNLDIAATKSVDELKKSIRENLSDDISSKDFDVGYLQGSSVVRIRNMADILEVSTLLQKPQSNVVLWCDGLRMSKKRVLSDSEDDSDVDFPPRKVSKKKARDDKERNTAVQECVDDLKDLPIHLCNCVFGQK